VVDVEQNDAVDDFYTAVEDTPLVETAPGVRTNDTDVSANPSFFDLADVVTPPEHGDLTFEPGAGGFTYRPDREFAGIDSFTYAYFDGARRSTDTATVTIDVQEVNDPPGIYLRSGCLVGELCLFGEVRDVTEPGTVTVGGYLTDAEGDAGDLTIDWGDGNSTPLGYPCTVPGSGCPFGTTPLFSTPVECIECKDRLYFSLQHTYRDDGPLADDRFQITVHADDGAETAVRTTARVKNVAPTLALTSAAPVGVPLSPVGITAVVADPADAVAVTVDWGDGTRAQPGSVTCQIGPGAPCYVEATHSYATVGTYTVTVTASDGDGGTDVESIAATINPAPGVLPNSPSGVTGLPGDGKVTLQWLAPTSNAGAAVNDYVIQFSTDDGLSWTTAGDGVATTTSAVLTGLGNGVGYRFRVAAVNSAGTGAFSAASSAITPRTTPGRPTSLVGVPGAGGQVRLTWTAPESDGGSPITDYRVYYSVNGANMTQFADGVSTNTAATVTGLDNGTPYYFWVRPVNVAGAGLFSDRAQPVTPRSVPFAPRSINARPGDGEVTLSWLPSSDGGSPVTDYLVQYSSDGGSTWTTFADGVSTEPETTVTGLVNKTVYVFRVAAINDVGTGSFGVGLFPATPRTTPGAPTGVVATGSNQQAALTWEAPLDDGGSPVGGYLIEQSSDGGVTWTLVPSGTVHATNFTVTGLTNGLSYEFRIFGVNIAGVGEGSASSNPVVPSDLPSPPRSPVAVPGSGSVTLEWLAPVSDGGAAITDYVVQQSPSGTEGWVTVADGVSTATTATISGLTNGAQVYFRVAALNAAGTGINSSVVSAVPRTVPAAPTSTGATAGPRRVRLTWTAPVNGGAPITDYVIQRSPNGVSRWTRVVDDISTTPATTVANLASGTRVYFRIAAQNAVGTGPFGSAASAIPLPASVPGRPRDLSVTVSRTTAHLRFTAPPNGGSTITSYSATCASTNGGATRTGTAATSPVAVATLSTGRTYTCTVRARNAVGDGPASTKSTPFVVR
jgi:predicted phage tail protein